MSAILRVPPLLANVEQQYEVVEDFLNDVQSTNWTATVTDTGTVAVGDAPNGIVTLTPSDGTVADNDEAYYATANELFLFAQGKPFWAQARLKFVETASGTQNILFGFANAFAADLLVNDGAGVRTSGSVAAIYKVDGETVWRCVTRNNGVVTVTQSTATAGGTSYQRLEIEAVPVDGEAKLRILFRCDGVPLKDSDGREIIHTVAVASATEMQLGFGVKLGAGTNNDTLLVDYAAYAAARQ
jgi:hypothetical protein